jgi:hypothetical protein
MVVRWMNLGSMVTYHRACNIDFRSSITLTHGLDEVTL